MNQVLYNLSSTKYYGFYIGQVLNNQDPDNAQKCQVAIGPMFLGIAENSPKDLPWASPAMPLTFGAGSGYGAGFIPNVNSWVYCFFLEGDVYQPRYAFECTTLTQGIPSNTSPTIRGWASPSGIKFSVDDGNKVITITHPTGTSIRIDAQGNVNVNSAAVINLITNDHIEATTPEVDTTGNLNVATGATGTFGSSDGALITVSNGIITDID